MRLYISNAQFADEDKLRYRGCNENDGIFLVVHAPCCVMQDES